MEKKKSLTLVGALILLSVSILISANMIANAVSNAPFNMPQQYDYTPSEDYELIVNDGWLYIHNKVTGEIWQKPALVDDASWQREKHFNE